MPLVFVVEDDAIIRESLVILLETEGYHVGEAANGRDALNALKRSPRPPCMILLDLSMPVMDGVEFRRHQLQDPHIASVPVVVVTGKNGLDESEVLRPLTTIHKPFDFNAMLHVVREHCPLPSR
jgi:CheY-like chemotaxis protein